MTELERLKVARDATLDVYSDARAAYEAAYATAIDVYLATFDAANKAYNAALAAQEKEDKNV
jgi:hypothetical protein